MASLSSFDIVSDFDQQELKNALDQTQREIQQRMFNFLSIRLRAPSLWVALNKNPVITTQRATQHPLSSEHDFIHVDKVLRIPARPGYTEE